MSDFQKVIKYCAIAFAVFLAVAIISGIATAAVSIVSAVTGNSIFQKDVEIVDEYTKDFSDVNGIVKNIDIKVASGQLVIKNGLTFRVDAENVTEKFEARVTGNGTLIVEENRNNVNFLWFNFNGFGNPNSKIIVTIPADFVANNTNIDTGAGRVEIEQLNTGELVINAGAGNISGSHMTANEVSIDGGVGSVEFNDVNFVDADINCGVGNLNIKGNLYGDNTIDCGVGEVDLELNGKTKDYELDIDAGVGTVRINGEKVKKEHRNNGTAEHSIEIDGGVGNVSINFAD